jgi:chorismate dehydratase
VALRVGVVDYVNSRPLAWGLAEDPEIEPVLLPPAGVADELAAGRLDAGLLPSIELARIPNLAVVPGLAIAARHEVRSVLLVSRVPVAEIRSLALDENSRTSAVLARLVLAGRYAIAPRNVTVPPRIDEMLAVAEAAVVIGDPALHVDRDRWVVLDLAGEWLEMVGLPFVFAVWAARADRPLGGLVERLQRSHREGMSSLPAIVARASRETGLPEAVLEDYYRRNLRFDMGPAEQAGLAEFLRRAAAAGHCPPVSSLRFLTSGQRTPAEALPGTPVPPRGG